MTKREREKRKIRYSDPQQVAKDRDVGFVSKAFNKPDDMPMFRWTKEKTYRLEIMPYIVGPGNPMADEDTIHYERTYYTHRDVGPKKDTVLCNAKTLGKKCPVCEHREKLMTDPEANKKLTDSLKYKERQLYIVRDLDEPEKGFQLLETAYYKSFGELLEKKCKAGDDDNPFHKFHHLQGGMILKVLAEEDTFEGKKFFKAANIEMAPRKKDLPESILDEVPCLDKLLVEADYKELKKSFLQIPDDEDEDEDEVEEGSEVEEEDDESEEDGESSKKPSQKASGKSTSSSKKPSKKEDEEEEDDEVEEEEETEEEETEEEVLFSEGDEVKGEYKDKTFTGTVKKVINGLVHVETLKGNLRVMDPDDLTLVKKAKKKKPAEDEEVEEEEEEEIEVDEEEDEEEAPAKKPKGSGKKPKTSSKKPSKDEDEEEDVDIDEDEEDEDE